MLKIFCEGVTDQIFIADCIESSLDIKFRREKNRKDKNKVNIICEDKIEIIEIGGCKKLNTPIHIDKMKDNLSIGGSNIVVFDADHSKEGHGNKIGNGNNGFRACKQQLNDLKVREKVNFTYFLWPDNKNDGDIEYLLEKLIPNSKIKFYNCIGSYQSCVEKLNISELRKVGVKEKMNSYLHSYNQKPNAVDRNYQDINFWNLNHSEIEELKIFIDFLIPTVKKHL